MTWRQTILFWLGAAILSLSSTVCGTGFDEDRLECEQAIAHLVDCCPNFPVASATCEYIGSFGCLDGGQPATVLSISESQCIEQLDCAHVQSTGLCQQVPAQMAAAQANPDGIEVDDDDGGSEAGPSVCE